jgi:hypothetical protein
MPSQGLAARLTTIIARLAMSGPRRRLDCPHQGSQRADLPWSAAAFALAEILRLFLTPTAKATEGVPDCIPVMACVLDR